MGDCASSTRKSSCSSRSLSSTSETRISDVVEQAGKGGRDADPGRRLCALCSRRGIDRHRPDFAAEVAAQLKN